MMNQPEKLLQLRAKTDQQLLDFVQSKLELGLHFAVAEAWLEGAQRAFDDALELLPVINQNQRRALEPKVIQLREALQPLRRRCDAPRVLSASGF